MGRDDFCLRHALVLVALLLAVAPIARARAENLLEVYALAKQNDPRLKAARLELEAVAYGIEQARSGFLPTIAADVSKTRTNQNVVSSSNTVFALGAAEYPQRDMAFSLTQPVFRLAVWHQYAQAKAAEKQAAATFAAAEQDLILRSASAYLGVMAAHDALELARAERSAIQSALILADTKYRSGQATVVSLRDAESRAALKDSDLVLAENDLQDKIQALSEIIGKRVATVVPFKGEIALSPPQPEALDQWVQGSLLRNLLLEARTQAVEVARREVDKQRAAYYPTVDLSVTSDHKVTGGSLFGGGSDIKENDVMLRLHIPFFDGGYASAVSGAAAKRYEQSKEDLERDRRAVERQARAAYLGVVGGIQRVKALDQSVVSLESARQLKQEGYKAGIATVLAVLDAERDLYTAKRSAAQATYDYLLNMLRLKQASGTLSDEDIERIGRLTR